MSTGINRAGDTAASPTNIGSAGGNNNNNNTGILDDISMGDTLDDVDFPDCRESLATVCLCGECQDCQARMQSGSDWEVPKIYNNINDIVDFCNKELEELELVVGGSSGSTGGENMAGSENKAGDGDSSLAGRIPKKKPGLKSTEKDRVRYEWRYLPYKTIVDRVQTDSTSPKNLDRHQRLLETAIPRFGILKGYPGNIEETVGPVSAPDNFGKLLRSACIETRKGVKCCTSLNRCSSLKELVVPPKKMGVYSCYVARVRLHCVPKKRPSARRNESGIVHVMVSCGRSSQIGVTSSAKTDSDTPQACDAPSPSGTAGSSAPPPKKKRRKKHTNDKDKGLEALLVIHPALNVFYCAHCYDKDGSLLPMSLQWL